MLPSMVLKKMVMGNFSTQYMDSDVTDSVDFMVEKVKILLKKLSIWEMKIMLPLTFSWIA